MYGESCCCYNNIKLFSAVYENLVICSYPSVLRWDFNFTYCGKVVGNLA